MYCRVWLPLLRSIQTPPRHTFSLPFRPTILSAFHADTSSTTVCTVVSGSPYFIRFGHHLLLATPFRCPSGQTYRLCHATSSHRLLLCLPVYPLCDPLDHAGSTLSWSTRTRQFFLATARAAVAWWPSLPRPNDAAPPPQSPTMSHSPHIAGGNPGTHPPLLHLKKYAV
jgi:hypothetical protein